MVNGSTAQLAIRARAIGLGLRTDLLTFSKLVCTIIGYIMAKRQIAIGIEMWGTSGLAKISATRAKNLPKIVPAATHGATHNVRQFSRSPSLLSAMYQLY
jgi:hypothetical protein